MLSTLALLLSVIPAPATLGETLVGFERVELSDRFRCEGATFADLDRDGHNDVIAGPYWYAGPVFVRAHTLYEPKEFDALKYSDNFFAFTHDFDGDDWTDVLVVGFPGAEARWYENPGFAGGEAKGEWKMHLVFQGVDNESPTFTDLTGDGEPELVFHTGGRLGWASPDPERPTEPWTFHALSPERDLQRFTHGLGVGDVNGDGRMDLLEKTGWWAQPESLKGDPLWERHAFPFADAGGAQMYAFDVDGDRDADVVTSLYAHGYGLAWYEQKRGAGGELTFERHTILGEDPEERLMGVQFSELHALDVVDVDGDGLQDIVTGKRWWSHGPKGNLGNGTPDLYWFQLVRDGGAARFVPHLIDDASGVGTQVVTGDVDGDGQPDVVVGNKKGAFLFLQRELLPGEAEAARNLDFESGTLDGWHATGDAFEDQPVRGDTIAARLPQESFHQGDYWIGGYEIHGDGRTGTLQSRPFVVTSPWCSFLVGGGSGEKTCVELRLAKDDSLIYRVPGPNYEPMQRVALDVADYLDRRVTIRVVDEEDGGWGHINFDDFQFHETEPSFEPPEGIPRVWPEDPVAAEGLAPREAAAAMDVPEGFRVDLIAAEPDLHQPVALSVDARGRLWVVEAHSYPEKRPEGEGLDRILVFEDANSDGTFERRTVFASGLNLVSGLAVGFGGAWVGAAPELLFIPDRDGDLVPDGPPEVKLDGWGLEDTHETLNAFRFGPDGWLYGCHGVFTHSRVGKPGTPDEEREPINAGVWRYHPQHERFEVFSHGTSNPWGVDFDARGQAFVTACVIPHLFHMVQGGHYERQAGEHFNPNVYEDIGTIADHRHYLGDTPHAGNRRSNSAGGGHAHCGAMFIHGDAFPETYRGTLLMNNVHGNRVNRDRLERDGSGFIGKHEDDFLIANDAWFRGIALETGPDGSVYLIDWFDAQACHSTDVDKWDRGSGRLYRVSYGEPRQAAVDLRAETSAELVRHLRGTNEWLARGARLVLQERGPDAAIAIVLTELLRAEDDEALALRLLWALHASQGLSEELGLELLASKHEAVRAWTVQLLCESPPSAAVIERLSEQAFTETSAMARLYLASALQRLAPEDGWRIAEGLLGHGEDVDDPNIPYLLWYGLERLVGVDAGRALELIHRSEHSKLDRFLVRRVANDSSCHESLVRLLNRTREQGDHEALEWMLEEFDEALSDEVSAENPIGWKGFYRELGGVPKSVRQKALWLSAIFGEPEAFHDLAYVAGSELPEGRETPMEDRIRAVEALVRARASEHVPLIQGIAVMGGLGFSGLNGPGLTQKSLGVTQELAGTAIRGLAAFDNEHTPKILIAGYSRLDEANRRSVLQTLTSRQTYALELLDAVDKGRIPRTDLDAVILRNLESLDDEAVTARVAEAWGVWRKTPEEKAKRIEELEAWLTPQRLDGADRANGRDIYARTCAQCHTLFGEGGHLGPELTGSNRRDVNYLLTNMVDPNGVIGKDYQVTIAELVDGRIVTGIRGAQSETAVSFTSVDERIVVGIDEIEEEFPSTVSMMPEGQLDTLTEDEIADLVAYLGGDSQAPRRATTANQWQFFDEETLAGWSGNEEVWSVEDVEIVGRTLGGLSRNEFLKSDLSLGDFRLVFWVKLVDNEGNSGVQFRSRELPGTDGDVAGYQADIGAGWWGKLYEEHGRAVLSDRSGEEHVRPGRWNQYEILAVGNRIRTWINGGPCVDLEDPAGAKHGIIALQVHSGGPTEVRFRGFELELDPTSLESVTRIGGLPETDVDETKATEEGDGR